MAQPTFTLNPSYSGPMVLAETLRKMKSNNGLNRMLSTYNKRFFVLDLNHFSFYYLPDRQSHFANSTNIPLAGIIGIKVTKQPQGLEEDRIWKHEFVITTKKKSFELITDCKNFMHKILYAFGNIINTTTNKPLFNWDHYIGTQGNQSSPIKLPLPKSCEASPQKQAEASFASPEESPDVKTFQPEQRGEALSAELTKIERASKEEAAQQSPDRESCNSDDQKENKYSQEGIQKKNASLQMRRKGNSNFAVSRGKGFALEEEQEKPEQKEEVCPPVNEEPVESVQEQEEPKQNLSPVKEKLQIKLEMLSFDKIVESEIKGQEQEQEQEQEQRPLYSNRDMSKKYNPREQVARRTANRLAMSQKSASMNVASSESEFVGFNEIDLTTKNKSSKGNEGQRSARMAAKIERQPSFGTGVGQEVSRFSLFKGEKAVEVKESERNDDDWDNEMFGDGKHQVSPLKPKNYEDKQRPAYEYKYMSNEKKLQSQLSHKRSEFVASRQGTHNDWDDEL